ncbi:hypothetical protein Bca4012_040508 [Brassica carinata]
MIGVISSYRPWPSVDKESTTNSNHPWPCLPYIAEVRDLTWKILLLLHLQRGSDVILLRILHSGPLRPHPSLDQLRTPFPHLELTTLSLSEFCAIEFSCEDHGNDFNAAMKSLYSLTNPPASGDDWVALLVREVTQSTGIDDAKVRVATVLEALEKVWRSRKQIPRGECGSAATSRRPNQGQRIAETCCCNSA